MKKFILLLTFSLFISFNSNAQWVQQNSGTSADMASIKFINRYTGWACGYGVILKTTNGGVNWISQNHPATNKSLMKILPLDSDIVYCVGYFQTILKTINGGINWTAIRNGPFGSGNSFFGMFFLNYNTGWIVGGSPYILKTTNSGNSFDSIVYLGSNTKDIYFKDLSTGLLCGDVGKIRESTNGGYNWFDANINLHNQGYEFKNLSIINNQYVWIIGKQVYNVYKSTDFGSNFDSIGYVNNGFEIYSVRFINNLTGWCGGGGTASGRMFRTTNGGQAWTRLDTEPSPGYIFDYFFLNDSIGWSTGGQGKILFTTNGGISYVRIISTEIPEIFKLFQNYPNPFNQITNIKYLIAKSSDIRLEINNLLGQKIAVLVNEKQTPGLYDINLDCSAFSSGIYFYRIQSGDFVQVKRMVLIK